MKFQNPHYKSPVQLKIEQHTPTVNAWLQGQAANRIITLAELRAGLPAIAADLSRPVVNGICDAIGAQIMDPEDRQA